jgi:hypothetical protein
VSRCVLGPKGCVLVPRSSGTPVATWAWPTWVVSRRRVLVAAFILLEFPSPSRRIFIGSHSLPPSLVHRIGPSLPTRIDTARSRPPNQCSQTLRLLESDHLMYILHLFQIISHFCSFRFISISKCTTRIMQL